MSKKDVDSSVEGHHRADGFKSDAGARQWLFWVWRHFPDEVEAVRTRLDDQTPTQYDFVKALRNDAALQAAIAKHQKIQKRQREKERYWRNTRNT